MQVLINIWWFDREVLSLNMRSNLFTLKGTDIKLIIVTIIPNFMLNTTRSNRRSSSVARFKEGGEG